MNSVRELYLPHADAFSAIVADRQSLAPHYVSAAEAIEHHEPSAAAEALNSLAAAQEQRILDGER
jgi:hypothetical protein